MPIHPGFHADRAAAFLSINVVGQNQSNVWTSDNIRLLSDLWNQGPHHELFDEFAFVGGGAVPP